MRPSVPKTFAKAFRRNCDSGFGDRAVSQIELAIDEARIRRSRPRLFCVRASASAAPKRRLALRRRLELALLEIQRGKPPHVAALERHGDCRIQNRRRAIPIPKAAVRLGEQRQVVRPARLRAAFDRAARGPTR